MTASAVKAGIPILTLTTDFGTSGPYVAAIKGVILGLAPGTVIVDVSHEIEPQEISEGAFVLAEIAPFFPAGTVHLAVIDPGVGTSRRLIVAEVDGQRYVLPDNGLISGVLAGRVPSGVWEIVNPDFRSQEVSDTFHGRDILAPAAAYLLRGGDPGKLGPPVSGLVQSPWSQTKEVEGGFLGEVVYLDPFGNLITNITSDHLGPGPLRDWTVEILGRTIDGLVRVYAERPAGTLVGLIGSGNRLEIALVNGSAARFLDADLGIEVRIRRKAEIAP